MCSGGGTKLYLRSDSVDSGWSYPCIKINGMTSSVEEQETKEDGSETRGISATSSCLLSSMLPKIAEELW